MLLYCCVGCVKYMVLSNVFEIWSVCMCCLFVFVFIMVGLVSILLVVVINESSDKNSGLSMYFVDVMIVFVDF